MNPVDAVFARTRAERRPAFMPFLTAGDPDAAFTTEALTRVAAAGADLIEVGFPFSDPVADGPVIQASYARALGRGLKLAGVFDAVRAAASPAPVVGMASYSLVHRRGPGRFVDDAVAAGIAGAIVPDLPIEEAAAFGAVCRDRDFKLVLLVTPTTTPKRAEAILRVCTGFVYCVSVVGITGVRDRLPETTAAYLARLRELTDLPLCVGFGVSRPDHVRALRGMADGVIVGTALVKMLESAAGDGRKSALAALETAVRELSVATRPEV